MILGLDNMQDFELANHKKWGEKSIGKAPL
jgi:hypothetical protein